MADKPMHPLASLRGISKSFGRTIALSDVSLDLLPGSVHALMGENGAGKSTLMKVLAGVVVPDGGQIMIDGRPVSFSNPRQALEAGISTVFQELSLLPNLTIAENMFLGREVLNRWGVPDRAVMETRAAEALAELGLSIDPATLVSQLTIAERQFVEIAHGIKVDARVFILDEPTAALNAADVEVLNAQIRRLKAEGKSVVYISHRIDEIFEICDTVTVLKDGRFVSTNAVDTLTPDLLIASMVGRELADLFPERGKAAGKTLLSCRNLTLGPGSKPIDFDVRAGEIVGLAGLEGQGQREIARSLIGAHAPVSGKVTVGTTTMAMPLPANAGIRTMAGHGLGFVPEDRKEEGLFLALPIASNIDIGVQAARPAFFPVHKLQALVGRMLDELRVKSGGARAPVGSLSGGNQQKVLLGRYLAKAPDVLVIEEPTRGVDVGAKAEIYALLRSIADSGKGILVLSRETIELIGLCDRLFVVHNSRIVSEIAGRDADEHAILDAALNA